MVFNGIAKVWSKNAHKSVNKHRVHRKKMNEGAFQCHQLGPFRNRIVLFTLELKDFCTFKVEPKKIFLINTMFNSYVHKIGCGFLENKALSLYQNENECLNCLSHIFLSEPRIHREGMLMFCVVI